MAKRDFLSFNDRSEDDLRGLLDLAGRMKQGAYRDTPLAGKTLAMIFAKSSTRTRVSFEVGTYQLGGQALFLSSRDIQLGRGEPIADTARVLSRYVNGIMIRTFDHAEVEELARCATVPVINGLTDLLHPCQVLADLFTVREALGGWEGKRVAWVGDGNNMANSWIEAAGLLGFELRLACPEGFEPDRAIFERAQARAGACITITEVPEEARRPARDFPALPAGPPRRRGHGRGDRGSAVSRVGRGREPIARPEGAARDPHGLEMTKRTPLYALHSSLGAKLVPFGGYEMPLHYAGGIVAEHKAVREGVGVFDISHMGEFEVTGPDRNAFVQRVTCNDVGALKPGQAQYSA